MMKKWISVLLTVVLLLCALFGAQATLADGDETPIGDTQEGIYEEPAPAPEPEQTMEPAPQTTDEPVIATEEPASEVADAPTQEPTEEPTQEPTPSPTQTPSPKPTPTRAPSPTPVPALNRGYGYALEQAMLYSAPNLTQAQELEEAELGTIYENAIVYALERIPGLTERDDWLHVVLAYSEMQDEPQIIEGYASAWLFEPIFNMAELADWLNQDDVLVYEEELEEGVEEHLLAPVIFARKIVETPTPAPTATPTATPTAEPTEVPTATPTATPTAEPTQAPTATPTAEPTEAPTETPTATPTAEPTQAPTATPTATPTAEPTEAPTATPTAEPTQAPTATPTAEPTQAPTATPTAEPTQAPTATPTAEPTEAPTATPTAEPTQAPTATPTAEPTEAPTPEPTPEPTPTPTPARVNVTGEIVWVDNTDALGLRPSGVTLTLYANGVKTAYEPSWPDTVGNVWAYRFDGLDERDANGNTIAYSVIESPIDYYGIARQGTDFTNTLLERQPVGEMTITGTAKWNDSNDGRGIRPKEISVRLIRDSEVIVTQTVSELVGWRYSFEGLPTGDGYGHDYRYAVSVQSIAGYAARVEGYDVVYMLLAERDAGLIGANMPPDLGGLSEEELEAQVWLAGYEPGQTGVLLQTGDEVPLYPFAFAGIGALALAAALILGRRRTAK